eukprot:TRINITY_DN15476_c1_g1_i1.p1 TRINITY_DN15476_c1_g1~~TRINITY_DN15476_c1_g1_i1.p1  ORF type:complete len:211 (+),score=3.97 TRINITY_DN15476_c1_g1_i1:52-684(+)
MNAIIRLAVFALTSFAFLWPLKMVLAGKRHFEVFIGVSQLATSVLYNTCKALDTNIVLEEKQWHAMNNIISTTYGLLLLIHMQANRSEGFDMFLRYVAFSAVWIAQERDHYWDATNTAVVSLLFIISTVGKWTYLGRLPPYNWGNMIRGLLIIGVTGCIWFASMQSAFDAYGILHGVSQIGAAWALTYLWSSVPMDRYRKSDVLLPHAYF